MTPAEDEADTARRAKAIEARSKELMERFSRFVADVDEENHAAADDEMLAQMVAALTHALVVSSWFRAKGAPEEMIKGLWDDSLRHANEIVEHAMRAMARGHA